MNLDLSEATDLLAAHSVTDPRVSLIGVRDGWDGDGDERNVYDDAFFVVESGRVTRYRGNTNPSRWTNGTAEMEVGQVGQFRAGRHAISRPSRTRNAFRQDGPAWFFRKGYGREFADIAANLHDGNELDAGTSSLACQTAPRGPIWNDLRARLYSALGVTFDQVTHCGVATGPRFPYLLLSAADARAILAGKTLVRDRQAIQPASFSYAIQGRGKIEDVAMHLGVGFAWARPLAARLLGVQEDSVPYVWGAAGDSLGDPSDVLNLKGSRIRWTDGTPGKVRASIADVARACGWGIAQDGLNVTLTPPVAGKKL